MKFRLADGLRPSRRTVVIGRPMAALRSRPRVPNSEFQISRCDRLHGVFKNGDSFFDDAGVVGEGNEHHFVG